MWRKLRRKIAGKKKLATFLAVPVVAIIAWPFVVAGFIWLLLHKKIKSPKWKYGLITLLSFLAFSYAPSYYAGLTTNFAASPNTFQDTTLGGEAQGALIPTE